ncbi:MAG: Ig-like domain-containing protein [Caldilineaceae bacterium]|nr:Ig-like domain-containing protein [Caldilineaceae bacterium]
MQALTRFSSLLRFCLILMLGGAGLTVLAATGPAAGSPVVGAERLWQISQAPAHAAALTTDVCGTITANTTWSPINSPYVVCIGGVTIAPAATLKIEPGVTVQFENATANKLTVSGALIASGAPTQPITFTGVVAAPGSWGGLAAHNTALAPAHVNLSYVTLEYGGGVNSSFGAQLYADQAVVTITHSLIRNGASHGVYVAFNNPQVTVHDTRFISNTGNAIQLNQPKHDIAMSDLSASGNGVNAVYIAGSTTTNGRRQWAFPGIPFVIDAPVTVVAGDALSIAPGSELQFTASGRLAILGEFNAIGLPNLPITLTGQTKTPGAWLGMTVLGAVVDQALAQLDYVTVEYGGSGSEGANIEVGFGGQLVARHSLIRYSASDGVRNSSASSTISILNSRIYSNSLYGVRNRPDASAILASNNWWGDANGPQADTAACSPGQGDKVTNGVLFRPVLTDTLTVRAFPLTDAPMLTLTPRRWFAPANGTIKVYFDITLRDANGAPLPGRVVRMSSSLGTVTDGGITDLNGKTLAYLVSSNVGEAHVRASLDGLAPCEGALSPAARVTFTPPLNITDLFPDSPASYFSDDIGVTPMPVIVGISTTIHAKLTNPLDVPLTVDVSFGFAQAGIGLAFGPIREIVGQVIPAHSSVDLAAAFVPLVSGHYCVEVSYDITAIGAERLASPRAARQLKQFNLIAKPGPMGTPSGKEVLDRADRSFSAVSKLTPKPLKVQKAIVNGWWGWAKNTTVGIMLGLGDDPPRQDYDQTTLPVWYPWPPVQPDANVSVARAAAMNATSAALADVNAYGTAATVALDRYGGASAANNLAWAAQQANAQLHYQELMGQALLTYAFELDAFVQVLTDEGETDVLATAADMITYQARLAATGFTAQEIADARLVGLTDAEIEAYRQGIIAADPDDIAGNLLDMYTSEAAISREVGRSLIAPSVYESGLSISGGSGLKAVAANGNTLAQLNNLVETLPIGNPLAQAALIDVRIRRIDLPADWTVAVSPAQVTLAPGEQTTVTVTVAPGAPAPQNSVPRVAVEGYANNQLLGGVAIDVVIPGYAPFARTHLYLPLVRS